MNEDVHLLPGEKKLIDAKPDQQVIWFWLLTVGGRYIVSVGFLLFVIYMMVKPPYRLGYQLAVVILATMIFFIWAHLNRISRYYLFTNIRAIAKTGIFTKRRHIVSYDKIADIHVEQTWLERLFGLASIVLEDISGNRPMMMVGLEYSAAERIVYTVSSYARREENT